MEYISFKKWCEQDILLGAKIGVICPLNLLKNRYRIYLCATIKPHDEALARRLSNDLKKIKTYDEIGLDISLPSWYNNRVR